MTIGNVPPPPRQIVLPPGRKEVGLPEDAAIVQVLHNRAARKTIVEVQLHGISHIHRLYLRSAGEQVYSILGAPPPDQSFEQAITCEQPFLFLHVIEWKPQSKGLGGHRLGLWRANLGDPPSLVQVDLSDVLPPDARITGLLRANDDGTRLEANVLLNEDAGEVEGYGNRKRARYTICTLDLTNRQLTELDTLPGIQF